MSQVIKIDDIKSLIGPELELFEDKFADAMKSNIPLLDRIMHYIVKRKGKQIRPMFVFLCAKLAGEVHESSYRAAALVELLHTATLVHDDVVDESMERRGFFSINALWKNKIAVLVGDYLLSKGLLLSLNNQEYELLQILSEAVRDMSEGELLQIEKTRKLDIQEDIYFDIIRRKTASLVASACAAGGFSGCGDQAVARKLKEFGELVGVAFQIKDDLFDYGMAKVGKPTGNDIKEKKMTLPLIYTLCHSSPAEKRHLIYIIKNQNKRKDKVREVIDTVIQKGGIQYAESRMLDYQNHAFDLLHTFPSGPARDGLEQLVRYTTERSY